MTQKVFNQLYAYMLQKHVAQGGVGYNDLTMPVRTVWGWYRKGQGVQKGQSLVMSETGKGLLMLVSTAACVRRDVPKQDRLQVLPSDQVHASFRSRAEEYIAGEVVYVADVAYHPEGSDAVAVCAIPKVFFDEITGGIEISKPRNLDDSKPRNLEPSEHRCIDAPMPQNIDAPKPQNIEASKPAEPGLFDSMLMEFARQNEASGFNVRRSLWTGSEVMTYEPSLLWKIYICLSAVVLIGEQFLSSVMLDRHDYSGHLNAIYVAMGIVIVLLVVTIIIQIKLWRMK